MPGAMAFDETPQVPPEVGAQMGKETPFSGVGKMMADQKPGGEQQGPKEMGALTSAGQAVEKVIDNMATMADAFKPFANRIKQMLQAGIAEATKAGQGGKGGPAAVSAKPPEGPGAAAGFAG